MREILESIAFEATRAGVEAVVVDDDFGDDDDRTAYVIVPHEYFVTVPRSGWPTPRQLSRTIALTVEHPGTPWFELSAQQTSRCAATFDINRDSVSELRRRGHRARYFQLGYSEYFTSGAATDGPRNLDVLYMGSRDARRDGVLARAAAGWWDMNYQLLIPTDAPRQETTPGFLVREEKFRLLRDTKVLVNLHRMESRALEWVRVIEAIANGCVVLSEHSVDAAPLVGGTHFVSVRPQLIGPAARALVEDPDRQQRIRDTALDFIRSELPLANSVRELCEVAVDLIRRPPAQIGLDEIPEPAHVDTHQRHLPWDRPHDPVGAAVGRLETRLRKTQQSLALHMIGARTPGEARRVVAETPSFAAVKPEVSVIVPLHNYAAEIPGCLDSVSRSVGVPFEVLVLDDESTDDSMATVRRYFEANPAFPGQLIEGRVNVGLAATRNALVERVRGTYVLPVDADNGIYPNALRDLTTALAAAPKAPFAYGPLAVVRHGVVDALLSAQPWDPAELRFGNYIDNMALIRTDALREAGGWSETMPVWEDYHLWLKFAERSLVPAFLPKIIGWYRMTNHSLRMASGFADGELWSRLHHAAPTVFFGADRASS